MLWLRILIRLPFFASFYFFEVAKSSFRVALEILRPNYYMQPAILAIPLAVKKDIEILLFVNLITMTPGTLSLELDKEKQILYVHAMFAHNPDETRREIKQKLEKRVIRLFS